MSGRPRKHGWLIWEWFPRWDDNGLTHWWSQERCASCTRSQYGSFAKREGHARAQLQKTRLWCCRTPLHVCDCRGQTLNESMSESISGILFPRKRMFLFVCPVAFHGMKINNFTRPYQNSPDRKLTTQRILVYVIMLYGTWLSLKTTMLFHFAQSERMKCAWSSLKMIGSVHFALLLGF